MKARKFNKYERKEIRERKLRNDMAGTGVYIYENNTGGELTLPKPTASGQRKVGPRERFQGDSYYKQWVGPPNNLLRFIEAVVVSPLPVPEGMGERLLQLDEAIKMREQRKLILDQPDTITQEGKIEHIIEPQQKINEVNPNQKPVDTLLTEEPLDGVEIILS